MSLATSLTPAERRRSLAAAICCVGVFGLGIGEVGPLLSLLLEVRGTDTTITGLTAASGFLGVVFGPLLAPIGVRRLGMRAFLLGCFTLDAGLVLLLNVFPGLAAWFVLRILLGLVGSGIFTASEAWINLLAGNAGRGRIIGLYAAFLSVGFALGPLLLSATGIAGWPPFIANVAIIATAALPLLAVGDRARDLGRERGGSPLRMFARAPLILSAVALFGLYETALISLLPIWAARMGMSARFAASTLTAVYMGSIAMQMPIGWLSDKMARLSVLRLCGAAGVVGALLVAVIAGPKPALFCVLFAWGGIVTAIYPVALGMAGDRFRGGEMVAANAAVIIAYGLGSLLGPTLGGAAMDLWNPQGLLGLFVLLFSGFLVTTLVARTDSPFLRRNRAGAGPAG